MISSNLNLAIFLTCFIDSSISNSIFSFVKRLLNSSIIIDLFAPLTANIKGMENFNL